ncbi:MAG: hypothetical protein A3G81_25195 [Betaproteobacteria bacterium RIFCSPLOWO2_12_FULL_65_14]|nr:MAG: hypothetical protein A3G81_25195 [Betaproteobacteria bacterium RIFCSPLOWO2_12_FULL_65_14]
MRAPRSLTARLALLLAAVLIAVLSGIGVLLYALFDRELRARDAAELEGKRELVAHYIHQASSVEDLLQSESQMRDALVGHERLHVVVLDERGTVVFASSGVAATEAVIKSSHARIGADAAGPYLASDETRFREVTEKVSLADPGQPPLWTIVALDATQNELWLRTYLRSLAFTLVAGALVATLAGFLAIRQGLAPLGRIARTAGEVSLSRLDKRIALEDTPHELAQLVRAFNAMLERLAASFRRLSEFSSDLAHELRTPLHNLLGHAEVALSRPHSPEDYRDALETVVDEGERLAKMVRDMLFLAQADDASLSLSRERFELSAELDNIVSFFDPLAEERNVALRSEGSATLHADRSMVRRAITNLLSNAMRHAPAGGTVTARAASVGTEHWVEVSNTGAPIPQESVGRLFDRFYRADDSRSVGGTGLGLAIVKAIMELHGGRVEVDTGTPGVTTFRLRFPA